MRIRTTVLALLASLPLLAGEDERPLVAKRLDDADWVVRALSAKAIGDTRYVRCVQWLRDRLAKETNEFAQAFMLRALLDFPLEDLARVGGKELIPAALRPLKAKQSYVRKQAEALLEKLTGQKSPDWQKWWEAEGAAFAFPARPKPAEEGPRDNGGAEEAKTHKDAVFEEFIYGARRDGLEVVFVLDQTGSMQPTIDAAKEKILEICEYVHILIPKYRVGLVTYDDMTMVKFPLTQDYGSLQKKLSSIAAAGGGDVPEGVDKGLLSAAEPKMGWSKNARKGMIVIGDAPPPTEDVPRTLAWATEAAEKGMGVNAISVGASGGAGTFGQIAAAANGSAVNAGGGGDQLVQQMLVLSMGKEHEKALSGFVDVIKSVRAAEKKAAP